MSLLSTFTIVFIYVRSLGNICNASLIIFYIICVSFLSQFKLNILNGFQDKYFVTNVICCCKLGSIYIYIYFMMKYIQLIMEFKGVLHFRGQRKSINLIAKTIHLDVKLLRIILVIISTLFYNGT